MEKPNCYECIYRRSVPGDAHSVCTHPAIGHGFVANVAAINKPPKELNIIGNQHGIDHGWFFWPINFDPIWLERCDGFTA